MPDKEACETGGCPSVFDLRRLGAAPRERGSLDAYTCPDILELPEGGIAVIGTDCTEELRDKLPEGASIADYERLVVIPRDVLLAALPYLQ